MREKGQQKNGMACAKAGSPTSGIWTWIQTKNNFWGAFAILVFLMILMTTPSVYAFVSRYIPGAVRPGLYGSAVPSGRGIFVVALLFSSLYMGISSKLLF